MKWKDKINRNYLQISFYVIITVVIINFLKLIMDNAPDILGTVLKKLNWIIKVIRPVIIGFVLAYLLDPIINFFEERYGKLKKLRIFRRFAHPRTWAAFTSVFILFIAVAGLISMLIFTVSNQMKLANIEDITKLAQSYMKSFNDFIAMLKDRLMDLNIQSEGLEEYVQNATNFILDSLKNFASAIVNSVTNISGYLTTFIFSFLIGFYFMIDGKMFMSYVRKVCMALFSDNMNHRMRGIVQDLDQVFSGYIRGQLADAFFMMILISTVLSITGVKFSIVIGIFAGIGNLIPYFGPIVAYISTTVVCLINGEVKTWIISMIALFIIQAIDGNLIGPKLLSRSIKIHPLIIIVSLIFGNALGGFLGMLLAVPVGAYIKLVVVRYVNRKIEKKEEMKKNKNVSQD